MKDFATNGLVERAKAILFEPDPTWRQIAAERASIGDIITRYALPLLAIGPLAMFAGTLISGIAGLGQGIAAAASMAVISFVMGLISLVVIALIADFLAPKFAGQSNRTQALKLVAYAMTPGWIAGIFGLVPTLGLLVLLASIYGVVLFYKGATPVMKVPADQAVGFTAVTIIAMIVVNAIAALLVASIAGLAAMAMGSMISDERDAADRQVTVPGVGTVDTAKLEEATKSLEGMASGQPVKTVDTATLQGLLPAEIGAYRRTAVSSAGVGGIGTRAEATYRDGTREVRVEIVDIAALGPLANAVGGMKIEQNREDADGYERTRTVDGAIQTEKWDNRRSSGTFATQVSGRFIVSASGEVSSIDNLKTIVSGIDQSRLAQLAR
ncbi:MAG: YIP1 family protein [Sphingomonadales bacterium]|nr:YIP1 family protein [Sphingomonadales bacterium]